MLIDGGGRVFVARRRDTPGEAWQMPQGGIDPGEAPAEAAMRELAEEVGTRNARILAESREWYAYDLPAPLVGKALKGRYRGQRQKWFALRFLGEDAEIDLARAPHPEFSDWRWVDVSALVALIVPFKREVYEKVVAEFRHLCKPDR
ncbi:MAG: RNA pyrophosphohydrolase [Proteobacteria bacterium]|nr:RNA pyrophosphohydrolase [Pseudomonadota bacterium]